jgi:hypothetical protein
LTDERIRGFVVGFDTHDESEKRIWKVRVNQRGHPSDGRKFVVASTHQNIELAEGLEVAFMIGDFGPGGKDQKAVDVMLASAQD